MIGPDSSAAAVRTTLIKLGAGRPRPATSPISSRSIDTDEERAATENSVADGRSLRIRNAVDQRGRRYDKNRRSTSVCYYNTDVSIAVCLRATVQADVTRVLSSPCCATAPLMLLQLQLLLLLLMQMLLSSLETT